MKTIIAAITATFTLLGSIPSAEAAPCRGPVVGSRIYISGYRSCGTPIYTEKYFVGYDCHGRPVWKYRTVRAPRAYCPPPPPRRVYVAPCPPPAPRHCAPYPRGGVVIQGTFGF
jgi:hypothetical protein